MQSRWFSILLGWVFGVQLALSQVTTGTITGTVRDSTGAVIPGVSVTAKNVDTGTTRALVTDERGRYQASNLPLGNYELQAQKEGFQAEVRRGIVLTVGREAVVNFDLQVGAVTQTVEVTGEAPLVETTGSSVSGFVETEQIVSLPLNGRSFDNLILLQPATALSKFRTTGNLQGGFTQKISIKGARPEQNSFLLDGTDVAGPANDIPGSVGGQSFGVDTVREVRVETSSYSAQYGRAAGGVINVVSKSGTNEFHGTAFEFLRNDNLDAARWEENAFCAPDVAAKDECKPEFKRNQFGFSLGGPILRDKTFFFGSYEALRDIEGQTQTGVVPTEASRARAVPAVKPYLDAFYPLPNGPDRGDGTAFFLRSVPETTDQNFFTVKVDHNFSANDNIFVRYTFDHADRISPQELPVFSEALRSRNQFVTLEETHIFSPSVLNSFRLGFNRSNRGQFPVVSGVDEATLLRLAFVPGEPLFLSGTSFDPGSDISSIGNANFPRNWVWNLYEASDDVSFTTQTHSLKFGALFKWILYVQREGKSKAGEYELGSLEEFLAGGGRNTIFRAALPSTTNFNSWRYNYLGWYVQDDIRLTPSFTLNLGFRHEFYTGPRERTNRWCNLLDLYDTKMTCAIEAEDSLVEKGMTVWKTSEFSAKNFGPRFGFAWDVRGDGRTSVRGGWGIYYDTVSPLWWQSPASGSHPPFSDAEIEGVPFPDAFDIVAGGTGRATPQNTYLGVWGGTATPSSMQWNLTIQRQLARDTVFQIGYLGSVGRHLYTRANENTKIPTILPDGRKCFNYARNPVTRRNEPNPSCPNGPLERFNPLIADTRRIKTEANSNYNALILDFRKRFSQGFQFQTGYTWAKAHDTGSGIAGGHVAGGTGSNLLDPYDWKRDRSRSDFDVRHTLKINSTWDLPFGPGQLVGSGLTGAAAKIVGGWQLGGILKMDSNSPIEVTSSANLVQDGLVRRVERPDLAPGRSNNPLVDNPRTSTICGEGLPGVCWFDPFAFVAPEPGFQGNLGRNTLFSPNQITLDFSLMKNVSVEQISEQFRVQFRAEFFNILNRVNFGVPAGRIFRSGGRRQVGAGIIDDTSTTGRQIQFGLKLIW